MAKQIDGECDACGERRKLAQYWVGGLETWACDECAGIEPDAYEAEPPEPCTGAAVLGGCTCRLQWVDSASLDQPEPIVDGWCPLHGGRDPDAERDQRLEDGR
jgi:hypothetical protein